jgi:hypothetical protein
MITIFNIQLFRMTLYGFVLSKRKTKKWIKANLSMQNRAEQSKLRGCFRYLEVKCAGFCN